MNFDPQNPEDDGGQTIEKFKRKRKWLFIGGIGCFTFLILCCGGLGGLYVVFAKPLSEFQQQQIGLAETSMRVAELLGDNPKVDQETFTWPAQEDGGAKISFRYPISGSTNSGTLIFTGKRVGYADWEFVSMTLDIDGEIHDLDPDAEFTLDIDF